MSETSSKIERRSQALFQENPYPELLWDAELRVLDANPAFTRLSGMSRDQILKMTLQDIQNLVISASGEGFSEAKRDRTKKVGEALFRFPSGEKSVERHTIPLIDAEGNLENYLTIYRDTTDEKKKMEEIRKAQEQTSKILSYLTREITELGKSYEIRAAGDLTIRYALAPPDETTKAVHDLLENMNKSAGILVGSLRKNIRGVNKQMQDLTSSAASASASIGDASKGIQQIAKNTSKVSELAEKSSQGVDQIQKAMQDMSAAVEEITSSMESVSSLSKDADDFARKGAELAGNAEKSMGEISSSSARVYEIVSDVEKQMGEIEKIVILIRDLANQTNLLALNAAIEAARAGDAGRGFAVVATEVKSLAQESRNSAERIEEMITTLRKSTRNASAAMVESKAIVEQGSRMVSETLQSFNRIASAVERVAKSTTEVAAATQEQAATTEEVTASVHEVADLVEQTAKEAGDAAAASEEASAAVDEIATMVNSVDEIAVKAMDANRKFRVD
ncbi:MAG: methyl-accepting chemotaxis protein [Methanoregulaceae archaeon]